MSGHTSQSRSIALEDAKHIQAWGENLAQPVSLRFVATSDRRSNEFATFCQELSRLAPQVRVVEEKQEHAEFPAILVDSGWSYYALPRGGELMPFLELLSLLSQNPAKTPETLPDWHREIGWPADLKIYVAPQCPFCPQALRQLQPLLINNPMLHLSIIDGTLFPELAERDGVRSVPTTILDAHLRWTGSIEIKQILDALIHRDPGRLSTDTLKGIIKGGDADRLAAMMLREGRIFPAFLNLLTDLEWSTRLGAMVVLEEIQDANPALATSVTDALCRLLDDSEGPVLGDLIYLLGLVGSEECIPKLEGILQIEQDQQMREVLLEALEKLRQK